MKNRILCVMMVLVLGAMLFVLTGCGASSADVAKDLETAVNNAIESVIEDDSRVLVKSLQEELDDKYIILGASTPSGDGLLSVKDYIEPDEEIENTQANMSITDSVDYLIIYDSDAEKEFRVRIFRQSNPPLASCGEDSEITK